MMAAEPFHKLAAYASDHVRVKAEAQEGNIEKAATLLTTRMEDVMTSFVEGDAFEDPEFFRTLDQINKWRGPASHFMMVLAARRQCEIMWFEFLTRDQG